MPWSKKDSRMGIWEQGARKLAVAPHPFGALLRRYRQAARLSQDELALKTGLSTRAISDLERGVNRTPRHATLALLADGLGLTAPERRRLEDAAQPAPPAVPHNLPAALTSSIGRQVEI